MKQRIGIICVLLMLFGLIGCSINEEKSQLKTAKLGEWLTIDKNMETRKGSRKIKIQVTKIERNQAAVKKIIDRYNLTTPQKRVSLVKESDKVEYCIGFYKAKYPKDFPAKEYGLVHVNVDFSICDNEGNSTIKVDNTRYQGLQKTEEVGKLPEGYDFYPGSTYNGMFVFKMVKGFRGYLIKVKVAGGKKKPPKYHYISPINK